MGQIREPMNMECSYLPLQATVMCDVVVLYLLKKRKYYKEAKFQNVAHTENGAQKTYEVSRPVSVPSCLFIFHYVSIVTIVSFVCFSNHVCSNINYNFGKQLISFEILLTMWWLRNRFCRLVTLSLSVLNRRNFKVNYFVLQSTSGMQKHCLTYKIISDIISIQYTIRKDKIM